MTDQATTVIVTAVGIHIGTHPPLFQIDGIVPDAPGTRQAKKLLRGGPIIAFIVMRGLDVLHSRTICRTFMYSPPVSGAALRRVQHRIIRTAERTSTQFLYRQ